MQLRQTLSALRATSASSGSCTKLLRQLRHTAPANSKSGLMQPGETFPALCLRSTGSGSCAGRIACQEECTHGKARHGKQHTGMVLAVGGTWIASDPGFCEVAWTHRVPVLRGPLAALDVLDAVHEEACPRLVHADTHCHVRWPHCRAAPSQAPGDALSAATTHSRCRTARLPCQEQLLGKAACCCCRCLKSRASEAQKLP